MNSEADRPVGDFYAELELEDVQPEAAGIPTLVFEGRLSPADQPTAERRALEVVTLWRGSVTSVGHFSTPRPIHVGEHPRNDFRVASDALPNDRFRLIEVEEAEVVVRWSEAMALEVRHDEGDILDADALAASGALRVERCDGEKKIHGVQLGLHDRVAIRVGEITFVIQYVSPASRLESNLLKTVDLYFTKVLSLSFFGHTFFVLALLLTPLAPVGLATDLFNESNRFVRLILVEPPEEKTPAKVFEVPGQKEAGRHQDEEGTFGKVDKPKRDALRSKEGAPTVDPDKHERDRKTVLQAGIFRALSGQRAGAVSHIFGPGGLGDGINNALGGIRGTAFSDAGGASGVGTRGYGPGGGGDSLGIGVFGDGPGKGPSGNPDLDGRPREPIGPEEIERVKTRGCLSREVVGRVLSRNHNRARYCYEKELPQNPNLSGKITTTFVIGTTGAVQSARIGSSTMEDPAVERCLLRMLRQLRFPACTSGTAHVTYPWIFKPSG